MSLGGMGGIAIDVRSTVRDHTEGKLTDPRVVCCCFRGCIHDENSLNASKNCSRDLRSPEWDRHKDVAPPTAKHLMES